MKKLLRLNVKQDVNWWTGVVWIIVMFFIRLLFWRHPFTAVHPLLRHWCRCRDIFLQTCKPDEETNSSTSWMACVCVCVRVCTCVCVCVGGGHYGAVTGDNSTRGAPGTGLRLTVWNGVCPGCVCTLQPQNWFGQLLNRATCVPG